MATNAVIPIHADIEGPLCHWDILRINTGGVKENNVPAINGSGSQKKLPGRGAAPASAG